MLDRRQNANAQLAFKVSSVTWQPSLYGKERVATKCYGVLQEQTIFLA